jgi:hypothetical protein
MIILDYLIVFNVFLYTTGIPILKGIFEINEITLGILLIEVFIIEIYLYIKFGNYDD